VLVYYKRVVPVSLFLCASSLSFVCLPLFFLSRRENFQSIWLSVRCKKNVPVKIANWSPCIRYFFFFFSLFVFPLIPSPSQPNFVKFVAVCFFCDRPLCVSNKTLSACVGALHSNCVDECIFSSMSKFFRSFSHAHAKQNNR
jgi:hypothetical protein